MKNFKFHRVGILFLVLLLTACSDHDSTIVTTATPGDPDAPASVSLNPSKDMALADGSDTVSVSVDVNKDDGTAVDDGTEVTCELDTTGNLSAASATISGGIASVDLSHDPILGADNLMVTITCTAGTVSGSAMVKFINQPTSAEVLVAFDQAVTNLASLQLVLNNTTGATFNVPAQPVAAVNNAAGSLVAANFAADSNTVGLINANGFDTGTTPIIRLTYNISAGLPEFSVGSAFTATEPGLGATTPPVTAANLVLTVTFDTNA